MYVNYFNEKKLWVPKVPRVVLDTVNYGTVWVLPATGYGVHGCECGVGKPDLRYTRVQP